MRCGSGSRHRLFGVIGGSGARAADQKMVLKASDVHPEGYPTVQAVENMGKKLAEATNGRLTIQMYASMQLGGEKEAIEQAQVGAHPVRARQRRRAGAGGRRPQRLQPAVPVPQHRAHGQGDRRPDRPGAARQGHRQPEHQPRRPVLDGCRRAQPLRHQEADQGHRRPEGPQDPRHGQPDVCRHDERARRQWRRDGLRPGVQRPADRGRRRRREQPAELRTSTTITRSPNTTP